MAINNTMPNRCLSFQVIFTGCENDDDEPNVHGGTMNAVNYTLVGILTLRVARSMETYLAQPWDCASSTRCIHVK